MSNKLFQSEAYIRLGCFLGILAIMALWEWLSAKRDRAVPRWRRWPNNLGVSALDTLVTRIVAPAGAVGFAIFAAARAWGLFNSISWPAWLEFVLALAALDLAIYFQHRIFHYIPVLWRLHRMHHADLDVDVTTGARFHPVEILLSLGIKFGVILALGAPALSVLIFEILLNATSMFNHSNVRMPEPLEGVIRWLVVTPDMHRTHHSILRRETDSNFGFNFPWWDRIFRTYRAQPEAGHDKMALGIDCFRDVKELRLDRMLGQPFRKEWFHGLNVSVLARRFQQRFDHFVRHIIRTLFSRLVRDRRVGAAAGRMRTISIAACRFPAVPGAPVWGTTRCNGVEQDLRHTWLTLAAMLDKRFHCHRASEAHSMMESCNAVLISCVYVRCRLSTTLRAVFADLRSLDCSQQMSDNWLCISQLVWV